MNLSFYFILYPVNIPDHPNKVCVYTIYMYEVVSKYKCNYCPDLAVKVYYSYNKWYFKHNCHSSRA